MTIVPALDTSTPAVTAGVVRLPDRTGVADAELLFLSRPPFIGEELFTPDWARAEAKARGVPIRIGVNAGSLEKELLEKYGSPTPEALVESAMHEARILVEPPAAAALWSARR